VENITQGGDISFIRVMEVKTNEWSCHTAVVVAVPSSAQF
jgi:hypothetical protein